jgi:hypothetical protein
MSARSVHVHVFDSLADREVGYAVAGINNPAMLEERYGLFRTRGRSVPPRMMEAAGVGGVA